MADTNYVSEETVITAETMQDLNNLFYRLLNSPATAQAITDNLPFNNAGTGITATALQAAVAESLTKLDFNGVKVLAVNAGIHVKGTTGNDPATVGNTQDALVRLLNSADQAVADFGFSAQTDALYLQNYQAGGDINLVARNSAGATIVVGNFNPDGAFTFRHDGVDSFRSYIGGVGVIGTLNNPPTTPGASQDASLRLSNASGLFVSNYQFSGAKLFIENLVYGGDFALVGRTSAGAVRDILETTGATKTTIHSGDGSRIEALNRGLNVLGDYTAIATDGGDKSSLIRFWNNAGTETLGDVGFDQSSVLAIQNTIPDKSVTIEAKNTTAGNETYVKADGSTRRASLYFEGAERVRTASDADGSLEALRGITWERVLTASDLVAPSSISSLAFDTATGTLTANQTGGEPSRTVNLDGRYLTSAPVTSVAGKTGAVTLVGADITDLATAVPVTSVAGKTGAVALASSDIGDFTTAASSAAPVQSVAGKTGAVTLAAADVGGLDTAIASNSAVAANTAKVTNATHTGDVTGDQALTIAAKAVNFAKMQDITSQNILGRFTATTGSVEQLTPANVREVINVEDGATAGAQNSNIKAEADPTNIFQDSEFADSAWSVSASFWELNVDRTDGSFPSAKVARYKEQTVISGANGFISDAPLPDSMMKVVVPGENLYWSAAMHTASTANGNARLYLRWFNESKIFLSESNVLAPSLPVSTPTLFNGSVTVPSTARYVGFRLRRGGAASESVSGFVEWGAVALRRAEPGATANTGTVEGVTAGTGLTGGGAAGAVTVSLDTGSSRNTDHASITIGTASSLTGGGDIASSRTLTLVGDVATPAASNYYGTDSAGTRGWFALPGSSSGSNVTGITFDTLTGVLTLSQGAGGNITVDLDGRYLESAPVTSVAGKTGAVTIDAADVANLQASISGNADVVANSAKVTNATHTGDVTGSDALTITAKAVTFAKIQDITSQNILGRFTTGVGAVEQLTPANVRSIINVADGATANTGTIEGISSSGGINGSGTSGSVSLSLDTAHSRNADHNAISIATAKSLTGGGTIASSRTLQLVGDVASPGGDRYYGTNAAGTKGFYAIPGGGAAAILKAYKTTSTSIASSTTMQEDPHLFVNINANVNYMVEIFLRIFGNQTADFKCDFIKPSGPKVGLHFFGNLMTTDISVGASSTSTITGTASIQIPQDDSYGVMVTGYIKDNTVSGTFRLRWAQLSSYVSATQLLEGSWMKLTPL